MRKKILLFLLLLALCVAASESQGGRGDEVAPGSSPPLKLKPIDLGPLGNHLKCCGYPYLPFLFALYKRPGHKRYNLFLQRYLQFLQLKLKKWHLRRIKPRTWKITLLLWKLTGEIEHFQKKVLKPFPPHWVHDRKLKYLWEKMKDVRSFGDWLKRQLKLRLKKRPGFKACLRKACHEMIKLVHKRCPHYKKKLKRCWWYRCCYRLIKPGPRPIIRKCCGYPYIPFFFALYKRPGQKRYNLFLRRYLHYVALKKRILQLEKVRPRTKKIKDLLRKLRLAKHIKRTALRLFSLHWWRSHSMKLIERKIKHAQNLGNWLKYKLLHLIKRRPGRKDCVRTACRKIIKLAFKRCGSNFVRHCWWWKICHKLLKSEPTTTKPPTTTLPPTTHHRTTETTCSTRPTTSKPTPIKSTESTPANCVLFDPDHTTPLRVTLLCGQITDCPKPYQRWTFDTTEHQFLKLCEIQSNDTCHASDEEPVCTPTTVARRSTCQETTSGLDCPLTFSPPYPSDCYNLSGLLFCKKHIPQKFDGCEWVIVHETEGEYCDD